MFDCHMHSTFSTDSTMEAEIACSAAIEKGLDGIAFVDHLDYDFPHYENEFMIDFDKYSKFMCDLKLKYGSGLKILKGIEVGIQPHTVNDSIKVVEAYDFDYAIGSVHIIDKLDPYRDPYYENKTKIQAYSRYLEEIVFMIKHFRDFNVIGHPDYITRYACYDDNSLLYADHKDLFDMIFKELISGGKGFEINTGSYREKNNIMSIRGKKYGLPVPRFDIEILKRYKHLGGEIICLGSDAHSPEYIGYKFDYFKAALLNAGFKYTVHFEKRKPVFEPV